MPDPPRLLRPGPPYRDIDLDEWDELENTAEAKHLVTRGILETSVSLSELASRELLDGRLIASLHQSVFEYLFPDLAGRLRGPVPNHLPVNVDFGQHRGTPYERVPDELERLEAGIRSVIGQLDDRRAETPSSEIVVDVMTAAA